MKRKEFLAGLLIGAVMFGATPAIASGIIAELSTQPIYVNGIHTPMTAYAIGGNNYVKLRDIGEAVGFGVSWNSAEQRVEIDSDSPYNADDIAVDTTSPKTVAEMVTQSDLSSNAVKSSCRIQVENDTHAGKLSTGQDATVENIVDMLHQFARLYPDRTSWGAEYNDGNIMWYNGTYGCNSYAELLRDVLYGIECNPMNTHQNLSEIQVGDVIHLDNKATGRAHWIVVSGVDFSEADHHRIYAMSGNSNGSVSVDAPYYLGAITADYPDSTIYTYY